MRKTVSRRKFNTTIENQIELPKANLYCHFSLFYFLYFYNFAIARKIVVFRK